MRFLVVLVTAAAIPFGVVAANTPREPERSADIPAGTARIHNPAAVLLNDRGEDLRKKGDLDAAIRIYTEAIATDPDFAWPFNNRGLAWATKGEFANAIKDYAEAIRLDPAYAYPFNNRGLVWAAKGDFENAQKDYTEAIRLDPRYAVPFSNRGLVRAAKSEFDQAMADYEDAIRLDPNLGVAYSNRGRLREIKGEFGNAIADYAEAIRLDQTLSAPLNSIAWLRATCHDANYRSGKEAIEFATRACELSGWKSFGELDTLAAAYAEEGEFTNAVIRQQTALEFVPASEKQIATERLELYRSNMPFRQPARTQ